MRKLITAGIITLAAVLAATPILAQGPGPEGPRPGMKPPADEAVMQAVQEADQKFWADSLDLQKQIRLKEAQLQVLLLKPQTNTEELMAANNELQQLINRMSDKELLHRFEISREYPQPEMFPGPGPEFGPDRMGRPGPEGPPPCREQKDQKQARADRNGPSPKMGQNPQGRGPGKGGPPPQMDRKQARDDNRPEMSDQDRAEMEKSLKEAAQLRSGIRLKMAELKVLLLTPETTTEALLAKNKELNELRNKLDEGRLLRHFEMKKRHPELALEREGD